MVRLVVRLYVNENFPMPTVEELRRLGCDVLTTVEAGKAGQAISDEQVLEFAREQQRVLVTLNRKHFHPLTPPAPRSCRHHRVHVRS